MYINSNALGAICSTYVCHELQTMVVSNSKPKCAAPITVVPDRYAADRVIAKHASVFL